MFEKNHGRSEMRHHNDRKARIDDKGNAVFGRYLWNWKGIVHYELLLLPPGKTIDSLLSTTNAIKAINSEKAAKIDQ